MVGNLPHINHQPHAINVPSIFYLRAFDNGANTNGAFSAVCYRQASWAIAAESIRHRHASLHAMELLSISLVRLMGYGHAIKNADEKKVHVSHKWRANNALITLHSTAGMSKMHRYNTNGVLIPYDAGSQHIGGASMPYR